ncbi:RHS repeat domain-containing protein [Xanthomarina gelatinilytica]|uniref:RHS repeat domain-containing protein n=1 Tax=Xanthomarina gelatinilytica TaxID=1137281 RepID=UPI003AA90E95
MKNGTNALSLTNKTDYYPFGMPMPNRNVEGDYRYKFQGQEKDPETGKEAFELRLWDNRIGRWLTTDPMYEFHSPYLGMGNNPISIIDPTGGCTDCPPWLQKIFSYFSGWGTNSDKLSNRMGYTNYSVEEIRLRDAQRLTDGSDEFRNYLKQKTSIEITGSFRYSVGSQFAIDDNNLGFQAGLLSLVLFEVNPTISYNLMDGLSTDYGLHYIGQNGDARFVSRLGGHMGVGASLERMDYKFSGKKLNFNDASSTKSVNVSFLTSEINSSNHGSYARVGFAENVSLGFGFVTDFSLGIFLQGGD